MADPPISRTAENRMQASVAATKLLRQLEELSGCSINSSRTYSRKSSSMLPWSWWDYAIVVSVPVEWILRQILLWILTIFLAWTSGKEERKSVSRRQNQSVHALSTVWLMFLVSHLRCATPPGPNSGGTLKSPVFQADGQWWIALAVRAINVELILSIHDQSLIPMCHVG